MFVFVQKGLKVLVLVQCLLIWHTVYADMTMNLQAGITSGVPVGNMKSISYMRGAQYKASSPEKIYDARSLQQSNTSAQGSTFLTKRMSSSMTHEVGYSPLGTRYYRGNGMYAYRNGKIKNGLTFSKIRAVLPSTMLVQNIQPANRYVDEQVDVADNAEPRRLSGGGDGFLPKPTPIGSGMWSLSVMVVMYIGVRLRMKYRIKGTGKI